MQVKLCYLFIMTALATVCNVKVGQRGARRRVGKR